LSCAGPSGDYDAASDPKLDPQERAVAKLEKERASHPDDAETALELGIVYFRIARKALDEGNQKVYLENLAKAQENVLAATELQPNDSGPHTWMGIIAAYQGDLDRVELNLRNAQRLNPYSPVAYTNLAEVYIYKGRISKARRNLKKARKLGAPPVIIEMNETLAAWRTGDYIEARDLFDTAYSLNPEVVEVWNEAPVSQPINSFQDFTRFCCSHVACGPYMENACQDLNHKVRHRSVNAETERQELLLEMERRRRLDAIYEKHRELGIEVEKPEE
jgi:tetratricopeptide (TPR) repeat protein